MKMPYLSKVKERFLFWYKASRGYSLPMSIISWLIIFVYSLKFHSGNILYGIYALIGIIFAHLGTNLFDDYVDFKDNVPKQKYKSTYIDNQETKLKTIFKMVCFYFLIAFIIGVFFTIKLGINIPIIATFVGVLCLIYPKINHIGLGEVVVGTIFGPILFYCVNYVMTNQLFSIKILSLSLCVFIFTILVLDVHAFMDYDSDIKAKKRTLCTILNSKQNAYFAICLLILLGYLLTLLSISNKIISNWGFLTFLTIPQAYKLLRSLKKYNPTNENEFIINFIKARNLTIAYEILLIFGIIL